LPCPPEALLDRLADTAPWRGGAAAAAALAGPLHGRLFAGAADEPRAPSCSCRGSPRTFFVRLGDALAARGHAVHRVNFNAGDRLFWRRPNATDFTGRPEDWPAALAALIVAHGVTDLVMFGDCRPLHEAAIAVARRGVDAWVFEEAYLRPGYITLEQGGVNGNSPLPRDPARIRAWRQGLPPAAPETLSGGSFLRRASDDVRYNIANLLGRARFPHWRTHRQWNPSANMPAGPGAA
jgi:capsular polysaccharide export protein